MIGSAGPPDAARRLAPVVRLAPAKLNLTLAVVGRRPDGFHDIHSVMVALDLVEPKLEHPRIRCVAGNVVQLDFPANSILFFVRKCLSTSLLPALRKRARNSRG